MTFSIFKLFDKKFWRSLNEEVDLSTEVSSEIKNPKENEKRDKEVIEKEKFSEEKHVLNETPHRIFVLSVLAIALSCFALSFSVFRAPEVHFVVVDMNKLLRQKAAILVSEKAKNAQKGQDNNDSGDLSPQLETEARLIRATIERYAAANKVIVVAKGAVVGGTIKEVTDEIEALL